MPHEQHLFPGLTGFIGLGVALAWRLGLRPAGRGLNAARSACSS